MVRKENARSRGGDHGPMATPKAGLFEGLLKNLGF